MKKLSTLLIIFLLYSSQQELFAQCNATTAAYDYPASCNGSCDGYLVLMTTGGTMPYTVTDPNSGSPITYTSAVTLPNLCAGIYTLTIQDAGGCTYFIYASITEPPVMAATVTNTSNPTSPSSCDGTGYGSASGGTAPYYFEWIDCSTGNLTGVNSGSASSLCQGSYGVIVTDANGCIDTSSCETWTAPPCTIVSTVYGITDATCNGNCDASATVTTTNGTPPYSFPHPVSGTTITYTSTVSVTGLCAGTWTLYITDAAGCTGTYVFTVGEPAAISSTLTNTGNPSTSGSCDGSGTVNVTGGVSPYAYNWIDCSTGNIIGTTTATANNLCGGAYAVEITDQNGCIDTTACVNWTDPGCSMVSTVGSPTASCSGSCTGTAMLASTNGTPPYTYIHPVTGTVITYTSVTTITGLCSGTSTLVINDNAGCTNILTVTITSSSPMTVSLSNTGNPSSSGACDGSGTASASGGTGPYAYDWLDCNTNTTIGNTSPTSNNLCVGSYYVAVSDANGCTAQSSCESWASGPCNLTTATSSITNVTCNGGCDGTASFSTTGGQMPYTFIHPVSGASITYTSAGYISGLCAGTWTLAITDANSCTDYLVLTITEPPAIAATSAIGNNPSGTGACDGSAIGTATGGTGSYFYTWIDCNTMTNIGQTTATASGLCAGSYAVIITDVNGCDNTSNCVILTEPTGIMINENESAFEVYPNPTNELITVALMNYNETSAILFSDISGRIILTERNITDDRINFNLRSIDLDAGIYFIHVSNGESVITKKIIYLK